MQIRNRIKEPRFVRAADLRANPKNWKIHTDEQRAAMTRVLQLIGFAGAAIAWEASDGVLELIDGHMRADIDAETLVPVLVLDVTNEEADILLASFDPLGWMAEVGQAALESLLEDTKHSAGELNDLLAAIGRRQGVLVDGLDSESIDDPNAEWTDMPEFSQAPTGVRTIHVHFRTHEDVELFAKTVCCSITHATRYIWFPKKPDHVEQA